MRKSNFNFIAIILLFLLFFITGCSESSGSENSPPYPVTGDNVTPFVAEDPTPAAYVAGNANEQYYYLFIEKVDGKEDPDGDTVFFKSETLPGYMDLNASTGVVTIISADITSISIDFWSEDENGNDTQDKKFTVSFTFVGS